MLNALWISLVLTLQVIHCHMLGEYYTKVDLCDTEDILSSQETLLMLECLRLCETEPLCVSFRREDKICSLYPQPVNSQCQSTRLEGFFLKKKDDSCQNAGFLHDGTCTCVHGFVGAHCETRMSSCSEGLHSGSYDDYDGALPVQLATMDTPFFVRCNMVDNGRLYVQYRDGTDLDLLQRLRDMAAGVGSVTGDHWLGLRYMHALLSSRSMDLTFSFTIMNGTSYTRTYYDFKVMNESSDFAIESFSSTSGNLGGDCLSDLIGREFSALDHDVDTLNWWSCVLEHRAAWWFRHCDVAQFNFYGDPALCSPNGALVPASDGLKLNIPTEVFWVDFPFSVYKTHIWLTDTLSGN